MLNKLKEEHRIIIASLLIGIIAITICSKSSFLYPFNDWGDSNCFFTVGKSIVHGIVPYKDLYEQKGPLLYLLHAIAYLISNRSFFGVYILEGICASIVTFFGYKLICLYVKKNQFFLTALSISLIYTSKCFSHGDSAEEFCLPIVIYCMYISIKSLKGDKVLGNKDFLTVGILSGCVFWIKFTLVGFFIGWFIIIAIQIIKKDNLKSLIIKIGFIILGVLIATIPYIVYFGLHNALSDWINVYIINNIFSY